MRLITLILPAILLCLLVPVVRRTAHAVPSQLSELRDLFTDIYESPNDFWLWMNVAWGAITALLTSYLLYLAVTTWLGLAYAVCLQLWRGLRSPAAHTQRTIADTPQEASSETQNQATRQARPREYHQRNEEAARIRASTPSAAPAPRPDSPEFIAMRQAAGDELRREGEARQMATEEHNARVEPELDRIAELRCQPPHPWQPNTESLFRGFC